MKSKTFFNLKLPVRRGTRVGISGFTLIELMMVSAIIGLLVSIALPKFGDLLERAHDANNLAQLGAVRSAITIYYADNEGIYPNGFDPFSVLKGKYFDPKYAWLNLNKSRHKSDVGSFSLSDNGDGTYTYTFSADFDRRNAFYLPYGPSNLPGRSTGDIWFACTHLNTRGRAWSTE